jgi:hypothetical protein
MPGHLSTCQPPVPQVHHFHSRAHVIRTNRNGMGGCQSSTVVRHMELPSPTAAPPSTVDTEREVGFSPVLNQTGAHSPVIAQRIRRRYTAHRTTPASVATQLCARSPLQTTVLTTGVVADTQTPVLDNRVPRNTTTAVHSLFHTLVRTHLDARCTAIDCASCRTLAIRTAQRPTHA